MARITTLFTQPQRTTFALKYPFGFLAALCILFFSQWTGGQMLPVSPAITAHNKVDDPGAVAYRFVAGQLAGNFEASLTAKEETDFLVTPALLMQEALSPEIVPTYPAE